MKKRIFAFLLISILLLSFTSVAFASTKVSYKKLTATGTLNTIGKSTLTLSQDFTNDKVEGISLIKDSKAISATLTVSGSKLTIEPVNYLEGDYSYTIKITSHSDKKYILTITARDTFEYDTHDKKIVGIFADALNEMSTPTGDTIIEIAPKTSKGFNYPYLLLIPKGTTSNSATKYMLVQPNNTGHPSSSISYLEEYGLADANSYGYISGNTGGYQIASALKTPLLIPLFPRPISNGETEYYTHDLDRATMLISKGDLKRIDLQLIAMIKDAQSILKDKGIKVEDKIFMNGFSASAKFANKFTALHPEIVKAVATGGVNAYTILPTSEWEGTTLNYPNGVADLKKITGNAFNETAYKKVAQYIYMGENDTNDILQTYSNSEQMRINSIAKDILGEKMMPDRWTKLKSIYHQLGYDNSIQFNTYQGIGHEVTDNVREDLIAFFKANSGEEITKITPNVKGF